MKLKLWNYLIPNQFTWKIYNKTIKSLKKIKNLQSHEASKNFTINDFTINDASINSLKLSRLTSSNFSKDWIFHHSCLGLVCGWCLGLIQVYGLCWIALQAIICNKFKTDTDHFNFFYNQEEKCAVLLSASFLRHHKRSSIKYFHYIQFLSIWKCSMNSTALSTCCRG